MNLLKYIGLPVAVVAAGFLLVTGHARSAEYLVEYRDVPVMKTVYGQVQSRDIVLARARIGGTVVAIFVEEGDAVSAGQMVANVVDQKLALRLDAIEARQSALSAQLGNARTNLDRAVQLFERGTIAKTRLDELRTGVDVLTNELAAIAADKAVIVRNVEEGAVTAPSAGRVLSVPVTAGSVILPGESIARIAGGGYYLRLSLPERHAGGIVEGEAVTVGARGLAENDQAARMLTGTIAKVYPEIENGRLTADVEVSGLGDFFVGERTLVAIAIGSRRTVVVPPGAIDTRHGIDYVQVRANGRAADVAVVPGELLALEGVSVREILTGLHVGDRVIVP